VSNAHRHVHPYCYADNDEKQAKKNLGQILSKLACVFSQDSLLFCCYGARAVPTIEGLFAPPAIF